MLLLSSQAISRTKGITHGYDCPMCSTTTAAAFPEGVEPVNKVPTMCISSTYGVGTTTPRTLSHLNLSRLTTTRCIIMILSEILMRLWDPDKTCLDAFHDSLRTLGGCRTGHTAVISAPYSFCFTRSSTVISRLVLDRKGVLRLVLPRLLTLCRTTRLGSMSLSRRIFSL